MVVGFAVRPTCVRVALLVIAVLQWFLVVVFLGAAATKLSQRERFLRTLSTLPWLSVRGARSASVGVPSFELMLAGLLGASPRIGGAVSLAALGLFTGVVLIEILSGRDFRCGCFGSADMRSVGWWTVGRNAGLLAAAALLVSVPGRNAGGAALVGVAMGLFFLLVEVGIETAMLARAR